MVTSLFSMFDPVGSEFYTGVWSVVCVMPMLFVSSGLILKGGFLSLLLASYKLLKLEIDSLLGVGMTNSSLILMVVFISVLSFNLLGMLPFVLAITSFAPLNMTLAISLWLGPILFMWAFRAKEWWSHLVPLGTPPALMPLMVLIESVSVCIRPVTLSVRLLANMLAGHLLLSLTGSAPALNLMVAASFLAQTTLVILEFAVAFLQSIVFMTLITLYSKE